MQRPNVLVQLVVVVAAAGLGAAFSNGTILPGYLCNPGQGLPTSLGGVLAVVNGTRPGAASNIAQIHGQASIVSQENLVQVVLVLPPRAGLGRRRRHGAQQRSIVVQVANVTTPITWQPVQQLVSGCRYRLTVASAGGEPVKGLAVYATNGVTLQKIGRFVEHGPAMMNWPACGPESVGAVHGRGIGSAAYTGLVWQAPHVNVPGQVQFQGVSVTAKGFGPWANTVAFPLMPAISGQGCLV